MFHDADHVKMIWRKKQKMIVIALPTAIILYFGINWILSKVGKEKISISVTGYGCGSNLSNVWCQDALNARKVRDINGSFHKTVLCPKGFFSLNNYKFKSKVVTFQCGNETARNFPRSTGANGDIVSVPFGDKCLLHVIQNSCLEIRTVPNVVHYVWYNDHRMDFFNLVSFVSAVRFVKPCLILIHGPYVPHGIYWDYFKCMFPYIIHVKRDHVTTVGASKLAFPEHGSDIMRIQALELYGGLYLDWDEVVLRPVDKFRDYPVTMGVEQRFFLGSQFIMARKGAPFLHLWLKSYETDYQDRWTYNALEVPFSIAKRQPELIHVESNRFTRPNFHSMQLIFNENYDWSDNYAIHLFSRWHKGTVNDTIIGMLNTTVGSVSRYVLYGNKELCTRSK